MVGVYGALTNGCVRYAILSYNAECVAMVKSCDYGQERAQYSMIELDHGPYVPQLAGSALEMLALSSSLEPRARLSRAS